MGETYYNAHTSEFNGGIRDQEASDQFPASLALVLAAGHDDEECDQGRELDDRRERDQEAAAAPHGAEELVVAAIIVVRERPTRGFVDGRAALM